MDTVSEFEEFLSDPDRDTFTILGSSASLSKMKPKEELADYLPGHQPHIAFVGQSDGVTHFRRMPDRASAQSWALEMTLAAHAAGIFKSMSVRLI